MGTSASFARKALSCLAAALLAFTLVPASALAGQESAESSGAEGSEGAFGSEVPTSPQPPSDPSTEASSSDVTLSGAAEGGEVEGSDEKPLTLASGLAGKPGNFINSDVALDGEPVIGSFTVDGLTYAVIDESTIELVGVAPSVILSEGSEAAGVEESNSNQASEAGLANLALPETVTYEGTTYALASIAPYAFYLSGVTDLTLPASVSDVDDRAFRSSDVASVEVAEGNQAYSSFDGALCDADKTRLLLIPEGRVGAVLLPREAEVAEASKFSHCSLVDAISVEDGAAFASENGLLYSSDLTTLLRVPAGAIEVTIREGCTAIAAGALEACAKLTTINAPATVTSISPDVFHAIPTVSLPAASLAESVPQLTAMVALSTTDDDLPEVEPSAITVRLLADTELRQWTLRGFSARVEPSAEENAPSAALDGSAVHGEEFPYHGSTTSLMVYADGTYRVPTTHRYFLAGEASGSSKLAISLSWTKGSASMASSDAIVEYRVSGYVPNITPFPAPVSGLASRWVRPECGTLIGFVSDCWTYLSLEQIAGGTFTFRVKGSNLASGWHLGSGAFRPVFEKVKHSFHLNYVGATNTPIQTLSPSFGSWMLPDPEPVRSGYAFDGWYDSLDCSGHKVGDSAFPTAIAVDGNFYAKWNANTYTVAFDSGNGEEVPNISATYDEEITLPAPTRQGYAFDGWKQEGTDTIYQAGKVKNLTTTDQATVKLVAQWKAVISADVPQAVEARVDVLGLEEQEAAESHIMSLCGEPLKVVEVECEPLPGATQVFGASASQVRLEALVNGASQPALSFALGASATEGDPTKLAALTMASYGAKVPISYRFAIPDALLPQLKEASASICRVAYTVGLA